ncbi:Acetokinase family-domain-containing protein [Podospora australis]|uniref:Probable acetate kinase n=1 Tax=Podospora australis TaxID=1536484 RepID=A0AAN6X5T4_9PEZI|nr:Acetokinase family-domain-containing protein [Podospora australis]
MASGRSGSSSSFNSSSLGGGPPSHFTPTSAAISALTAESSIPQSPLGPLDLGPPGYHATIKLFERTVGETTIYLGPWEIGTTSPRRIVWQCSYAGDVLEHFLPSDNANDLYPFTLHAQHRRFGDPREMELYLSFLEPHRLRYITRDGVVFDDFAEVKYEFTTIESSIQFQSDIRTKDLIDWFDVDVVWSDTTRRTDSYGNVRGLGTIQRMKMWRDRYTTLHYLTVYANHQWRWKEFLLDNFDKDLRLRDDRRRRVELEARAGRRGSASSGSTHSREQRRFSAVAIFGGRRGSSSQASGASSSSQAQASPEIRYLGIQFSRNVNVQTGTATDVFDKMKKIILAVNAGSSSVKISVYSAELGQSPVQIAETQVSGLTSPPATLKYTRGGEVVVKNREVENVQDQRDAFTLLLENLIDDEHFPEIKTKEDVGIVCHRIVHGGDYTKPQLISSETYHHLENLNDLAPLHNANSLGIVQLCIRALPTAANVACFDSQFHSSIPEHIRTYPINREIARSNHLRKYGFHGISYSFITRATAEFLGKQSDELSIIALHLGSGASACAIRNGKSWDTSMGLTPLAGLPGATRSGSVDPSLVFHYASDVGKLSPASTKELHISRAEEILNKESGWKALTGTTDFGKIAAAADDNDSNSDPVMKLAFDLFVDRICGFIGSYYVTLRGEVDALVFAGGIGEKSAKLRAAVVDQIGCLGFQIDADKNENKEIEDIVEDVGKDGVKPRILVCQTDEQFEMARTCAETDEFWQTG